MVEAVGQPAPKSEVEAIKKLEAGKFQRNTEEGWNLQTAQEKSWETERRDSQCSSELPINGS